MGSLVLVGNLFRSRLTLYLRPVGVELKIPTLERADLLRKTHYGDTDSIFHMQWELFVFSSILSYVNNQNKRPSPFNPKYIFVSKVFKFGTISFYFTRIRGGTAKLLLRLRNFQQKMMLGRLIIIWEETGVKNPPRIFVFF